MVLILTQFFIHVSLNKLLFGLVLHMHHIIGACQEGTNIIITSQRGTILLLQMQRQRREVTCQGHTVGRC